MGSEKINTMWSSLMYLIIWGNSLSKFSSSIHTLEKYLSSVCFLYHLSICVNYPYAIVAHLTSRYHWCWGTDAPRRNLFRLLLLWDPFQVCGSSYSFLKMDNTKVNLNEFNQQEPTSDLCNGTLRTKWKCTQTSFRQYILYILMPTSL